MVKRKGKKRPDPAAAANGHGKPGERVPKSMVIRMGAGEVGSSITQLVQDVREVMEPHTASRLRERKANRLRDYTTMAGPLGVTHLLLFSRSENGNTNMRLAITPRGPTFHFRVSDYSLCKDIVKSLRHAKSASTVDHATSPLLVMNNFVSSNTDNPAVPKHLESLATTVFQSLFAPLNPQKTPLSSIRRILLLDRKPADVTKDEPPFVLQFRHYSISTPLAKSSLPKSLRKLHTATHVSHPSRKNLPNLGRLGDVSDYLLDPNATAGFTSASETELDTDAEVEVLASTTRRAPTQEERQRARDAQRARLAAAAEAEANGEPVKPRAPSGSGARVEKKAIKLTELGPRMTMRLTKVEEGLCDGKIMWHEYVHKTKAEEKELERRWAKRQQEKAERRRIQRENVERKRKERGGKNDDDDDEEVAVDEDGNPLSDIDDDDDFWDGQGRDADGDDMEVEQG